MQSGRPLWRDSQVVSKEKSDLAVRGGGDSRPCLLAFASPDGNESVGRTGLHSSSKDPMEG